MHPNAVRRVPAVLDVIPFSPPPGDLAWVRCANCSGSLELHQPDTNAPGQLLGVCVGCGRWSLVELVPDLPEAVLILLPEPRSVRDASVAIEPLPPQAGPRQRDVIS